MDEHGDNSDPGLDISVGVSKRTTPRSRGPSEDVLQDRGHIVIVVFWNGKEAAPRTRISFRPTLWTSQAQKGRRCDDRGWPVSVSWSPAG